MASFVIKKDGTKVPFKTEKIKSVVMSAALEAGWPEDKSTELAQKVADEVNDAFSGKEEVPTLEIKGKVLSLLPQEVLAAWEKYEKGKEEGKKG